jgi:hypothetical protein
VPKPKYDPPGQPVIPALIGELLTRIAEVFLGHDPAVAALNTHFVKCDYTCFADPARGRQGDRPLPERQQPERFNRDRFAKKVKYDPGTINDHYEPSGRELRECAIVLMVLFGDPGHIDDRLPLRFQTLSSPIGKVRGPGKSTDNRIPVQCLFGPMLCEPYGYPHALIARPHADLTPATLVSQITGEMLATIQQVVAKVRANCASPAAVALLQELKVDREALIRRTASIDILVPRLSVGEDTGGEGLDVLYADVEALRSWMDADRLRSTGAHEPGVRRAVVEIQDDPFARGVVWRDVRDFWMEVAKIAFDADPIVSVDRTVGYAFEYEGTHLRKAHRATFLGRDEYATEALLSVALLGFDDAGVDERQVALAIAYMEALARRERAQSRAEALGQWFAPAWTQLGEPGWPFVESMRLVEALACTYDKLVD